jgi:transcription antitermination factor NusG
MPWMVVVSKTGRERDCRKSVKEEIGCVCYMPLYRQCTVRHGRKIWEDKLLLGSYFFARYSQDLSWRDITSLRLVRGLFMVPDADEPALVRDQEIEDIRSRENGHGYVSEAARKEFQSGQRVVPQMGVFQGHDARFVEGKTDRDVALVALFGQDVKVEFAPGVLRAA